jgi:hypothetical protein
VFGDQFTRVAVGPAEGVEQFFQLLLRRNAGSRPDRQDTVPGPIACLKVQRHAVGNDMHRRAEPLGSLGRFRFVFDDGAGRAVSLPFQLAFPFLNDGGWPRFRLPPVDARRGGGRWGRGGKGKEKVTATRKRKGDSHQIWITQAALGI